MILVMTLVSVQVVTCSLNIRPPSPFLRMYSLATNSNTALASFLPKLPQFTGIIWKKLIKLDFLSNLFVE